MKYLILSIATMAFLSGCKPHSHEGENSEVTTEQEHGHDHAHGDHDHSHEAPKGVSIQEISEGQKVFFVDLVDGDVVTSPLTVDFGIEGMQVVPAGAIEENKGHHHLLINHDFIPSGEVIPAGDSTLIHFGKGQLSTEVNLAPGDQKLTMQFANGAHMSYGEKMSATIIVTVEATPKHLDE